MQQKINEIKEKVTQQVIDSLEEQGTLWSKTWTPALPISHASNKVYTGINFVILTLITMNKGYTSNRWITFKECNKQGGSIKKGEKSVMITFYKPLEVKDKKTGEDTTIPLLNYFNVFNIEQTSLKISEEIKETDNTTISNEIESILKNIPCPIIEAMQDKACYNYQQDKILLPLRKQFKNTHSFYSVALHEISHSTGHSSRLNRKLCNEFGSSEYGFEEMIAELCTMYLLAKYQIDNKSVEDNSKSYIKGWLAALKNDKEYIFKASREATRAFEYIDKLVKNEALELAA